MGPCPVMLHAACCKLSDGLWALFAESCSDQCREQCMRTRRDHKGRKRPRGWRVRLSAQVHTSPTTLVSRNQTRDKALRPYLSSSSLRPEVYFSLWLCAPRPSETCFARAARLPTRNLSNRWTPALRYLVAWWLFLGWPCNQIH